VPRPSEILDGGAQARSQDGESAGRGASGDRFRLAPSQPGKLTPFDRPKPDAIADREQRGAVPRRVEQPCRRRPDQVPAPRAGEGIRARLPVCPAPMPTEPAGTTRRGVLRRGVANSAGSPAR
jgi:hypothetical protein